MLDVLRPEFAWLFPVLLLLWGAAYTYGMRIGVSTEDYSRRLPPQIRLVMIGLHLVMGLLWLLGAALGTPAIGYGGWVMGALVFDALGDLALGEMLPFAGRKSEIIGVALFAVGHIIYIIAILTLRGALGISGFPWMAVVLSIAFGLLLWFTLVNNPESGMLNNASLPYALLLAITTGLAADVALQSGAMWTLTLGLLLFAASDLLLAQHLIRRRGFPYIRDIVWLIYGLGLILIILSIGEAASII